VVESRNPLPAQIYTYKYIYIYLRIRMHTYTYTYIYIYLSICLWRREGAAMRSLKTMTSHIRWHDQRGWAVLGHGKKLIFLFCGSNIGAARASWFPRGHGSGQQLQAGLLPGPGLGFEFRSGRWTFLGMTMPRQWTPLVFFSIIHLHERVYVSLTFFYGRDDIRNLVFLFYFTLSF